MLISQEAFLAKFKENEIKYNLIPGMSPNYFSLKKNPNNVEIVRLHIKGFSSNISTPLFF